jgi:hypothetical protein
LKHCTSPQTCTPAQLNGVINNTHHQGNSIGTTLARREKFLIYYVASKWGTPVEIFNKFIQELDGGKEKVYITQYDTKSQAYLVGHTSRWCQAETYFLDYGSYRPLQLHRGRLQKRPQGIVLATTLFVDP